MPADALIVDQVYSYIYGNPDLDFVNHETLDLDAFRAGIRSKINEKIGEDLIHEVLVEQVDFLSKEEIRDNTIRRRLQAGQTAREMAKGFKETLKRIGRYRMLTLRKVRKGLRSCAFGLCCRQEPRRMRRKRQENSNGRPANRGSDQAEGGERRLRPLGEIRHWAGWRDRHRRGDDLDDGRSETDCTIKLSLCDLEDLIAGDLSPTTAFMTGKIKIEGDMSVAMALSQLIG